MLQCISVPDTFTRFLMLQGNHERARELFQEGVWADPRSRDTVFVFHAWGVLEKNVGNVGFARELFKAAIKVVTLSLVLPSSPAPATREGNNPFLAYAALAQLSSYLGSSFPFAFLRSTPRATACGPRGWPWRRGSAFLSEPTISASGRQSSSGNLR